MATLQTPTPANQTQTPLYTFSQFWNSDGGLTYINSFVENSIAKNQVNAKYANIPFVAPDEISRDGSNFIYPVVYRQNGYAMNNNDLNSTQSVLTQPKADKWVFNLQRWYIYTYTINEIGRRQGDEWAPVVAKQLELGMQWLVQNKAKVIRDRMLKTSLATGQFTITPNFVGVSNPTISDYAYGLCFDIRYRFNNIVTQFTQVNYGLIDNQIRLMLSYNGETTLINAAKGFGGSDAAFKVFKDGDFDGAIMTIPYEKDLYLGNKSSVMTTNDLATGATVVETLDLSNCWLMLGAIGAMIFPNNPPLNSEWKINFNFQNYAIMWNYDAAILPWFAYTAYAYLMANPTMQDVNDARNWITSLSMSNRFYGEYASQGLLTPFTDATSFNTWIATKIYANVPTGANLNAVEMVNTPQPAPKMSDETVKADLTNSKVKPTTNKE